MVTKKLPQETPCPKLIKFDALIASLGDMQKAQDAFDASKRAKGQVMKTDLPTLIRVQRKQLLETNNNMIKDGIIAWAKSLANMKDKFSSN
jgi:hypothetical protein